MILLRRVHGAIASAALWLAGRVDYWDTTYADACNSEDDE